MSETGADFSCGPLKLSPKVTTVIVTSLSTLVNFSVIIFHIPNNTWIIRHHQTNPKWNRAHSQLWLVVHMWYWTIDHRRRPIRDSPQQWGSRIKSTSNTPLVFLTPTPGVTSSVLLIPVCLSDSCQGSAVRSLFTVSKPAGLPKALLYY